MKHKILILIFSLFTSSLVYAHCPYEFSYLDQSYCLDIEWQNAESRVNGIWSEATELSPILNSETVKSNDRLFSKAKVSIWIDGDHDHKPVEIPNLEIYPYMVMKDGMHHGARSLIEYEVSSGQYHVSQMNFQQMEGCWSLRLKINNADENVLLNLDNFINLTLDQNYNASLMCSLCSPINQDNSIDHLIHNH